ncbi:hypothetical protein B0J17DRAFT_655234 [Rhizoctonia solani]|nr:hypothetical protein B0J17DRAFT_655234 [Rhizoctonia solani]
MFSLPPTVCSLCRPCQRCSFWIALKRGFLGLLEQFSDGLRLSKPERRVRGQYVF